MALIVLAGCASGPRGGSSGAGRDGAELNPPPGLAQVPDAEPRVESIRSSSGTGKPYVVLGRTYVPIADDRALRETGLASWYGTQFHSQMTASGEPYDMYAMTAAHKTLPLPSYVRVRNPANGREVIVRVNDRGPFHDDRVIDLSYTAALKLDLLRGVAPVEIERITNDDIRAGTWRRGNTGGTAFASSSATDAATSAPDSVSVPAAMTMPVVAAPRAEVRDLAVMQPLAPLPPSAPSAPLASAAPIAAPSTPVSSRATPPPTFEATTGPPSASPNLPPSTASLARDGAHAIPSPGFWIQLGAFSQRDGALRFQQQVARDMPVIAPSLNVFSENGTHRLQSGPYASRDVARDTAEQVRNGLQLVPVIVERR